MDALNALDATDLWSKVPERQYIGHSDLITFDCAQLTVDLGVQRPRLVPPGREQCLIQWEATLTLQLLRCVTALTTDGNIPPADVLDAENRRLLLEGPAIAKHLTRKWATGYFPPDGRCQSVTWGALEPIPPTTLAGWKLPVTVLL